ncbi:hypothetical protein, partial [Deinococcus pimensis]|uniref:hypothetical protein n=1 Tax=Deinococcus pimensis TaxID=309888 RepID=UPI0005EAEC86
DAALPRRRSGRGAGGWRWLVLLGGGLYLWRDAGARERVLTWARERTGSASGDNTTHSYAQQAADLTRDPDALGQDLRDRSEHRR